MLKETVISIIAVIIIVWGNNATYNYAKESISEVTSNLEQTREIINSKNENKKNEKANKKINEIHEFWDSRHSNLAYFIEHDELEKVETSLTQTRTNIEVEKHEEATVEIDKSIYILKHIENKMDLKLENIL